MVRRIIKSAGIIFLLAGWITIILPGCYYDVEQNLIVHDTTYVHDTTGGGGGGGGGGCDTTNVSYSGVVAPMIQTYCIVCHSQAAQLGSVVLEGYNNVKIYVENGQLLGGINWQPGYGQMPKDAPQLDPCTLSKINAWVHQGAPNN